MKKYVFSFIFTCCCIISKGQNVGIGTTNPVTKLHVAGGGGETGIYLTDTSGAKTMLGGGALSTLYPFVGTFSNHSFGIISGGYYRMTFRDSIVTLIGINTSLPKTTFHVATDNASAGGISIGSGYQGDGGNLRLLSNSLHWNLDNYYGRLRFFTETGFGTGGTVRAVLDSAGSLGLGTMTPVSQLSNTSRGIRGSNYVGILSHALSWAISDLGYTQALYNSSTNGNANGLLVKIADNTNVSRILELSTGTYQDTAGTAVMVVTGDGNLGLGTNTPTSTLHVKGTPTSERTLCLLENTNSANDGSLINLVSTNGAANQSWWIGSGGNNTGQSKFTISGSAENRLIIDDTNGNVGLGVNNPNTRLTNTETNILGSDALGINTGSLTWATNEKGYAQAIFNQSTDFGSNGLAIKIAGTNTFNRLLDLSTGAVQDQPGTSVFLVRGDGNTGIGVANPLEKLSVNGAIKITSGGYNGLVNNVTVPVPAGGAGTIVFSNNHFFGWNGTQWKQLDN